MAVIPILFFVSWGLMRLFEGGAPIASAAVYWWYFIVTVATVGYGDFSPQTLGGRLTGALIMIIGIGTFAAILTKLAETFLLLNEKKRKGLVDMENLKDHTVILGFVPDRTRSLINELYGDQSEDREQVVICAANITENPFPEEVYFVFGDPSSLEVARRSSLDTADRILVCGETDEESLAAGIMAARQNKTAHIVGVFRHQDKADLMAMVDSRVECIVSITLGLSVQALQDSGSFKVFRKLASNLETDATLYRLNVPSNVGLLVSHFGQVSEMLKKNHNALAIALGKGYGAQTEVMVNPDKDEKVIGGTSSIFYIASRRLSPGEVNWSKVC